MLLTFLVTKNVIQVLGSIKTLERLHPKSWLRDPNLTEDARFEALLSKIDIIDIGSNFAEALPVLRNNEAFWARSLKVLSKLRKLNLRAMLDHHCPT